MKILVSKKSRNAYLVINIFIILIVGLTNLDSSDIYRVLF